MAEGKGSARAWIWGGVGCVVGCIGLPILLVAVLAALGVGAFGFLRHSDVVDEAIARAEADLRVVESLGAPLEKGWMIQGSINFENDRGSADVSIPVSGPRGSGKLLIRATRAAGTWSYDELLLVVDGSGERIDLRGDAPRPPEEPPEPLPSEAV